MYFIKKLPFATALFFLLFGMGCQPDKPQSSVEKPVQKKKIFAPEFQKDSAYSFVNQQVAFGSRLPNTSGHKACKNWLVGKFKNYDLKVLEQPFQAKTYTGKTLNGVNIIAQYNPSASKRILLAAHWDTRHVADSPLSTERKNEPILGADDGGSGVGVLLEIARQLQANPANIGVDLVLFDAEDHGDNVSANPNPESWCLGSQHWAKNVMPANYRPKFGILLDMVGARNTKFPKEGVSLHFAPQVVDKVWQVGQSLGYTRFFDNTKVGTVTDDHLFVNTIAKIPMIDIIGMPRPPDTQNSFGKHWHTHNDNMDIIDAYTLRAVGQTLLEVIYREAEGVL